MNRYLSSYEIEGLRMKLSKLKKLYLFEKGGKLRKSYDNGKLDLDQIFEICNIYRNVYSKIPQRVSIRLLGYMKKFQARNKDEFIEISKWINEKMREDFLKLDKKTQEKIQKNFIKQRKYFFKDYKKFKDNELSLDQLISYVDHNSIDGVLWRDEETLIRCLKTFNIFNNQNAKIAQKYLELISCEDCDSLMEYGKDYLTDIFGLGTGFNVSSITLEDLMPWNVLNSSENDLFGKSRARLMEHIGYDGPIDEESNLALSYDDFNVYDMLGDDAVVIVFEDIEVDSDKFKTIDRSLGYDGNGVLSEISVEDGNTYLTISYSLMLNGISMRAIALILEALMEATKWNKNLKEAV